MCWVKLYSYVCIHNLDLLHIKHGVFKLFKRGKMTAQFGLDNARKHLISVFFFLMLDTYIQRALYS